MGRGKSKRTASNDWRSSHFLFISLAVTALSIMFFFAGRSIFNKMDLLGDASQMGILERAAIWGGFVVQKITLDIQPDDKNIISVESIERQLEPLKGKSIFSVNLYEVQESLMAYPWIEKVELRRDLPQELHLKIQMREASLVLRSVDTWIFVDAAGNFLSASRSLSGSLLQLPRVFGIENRLLGEPEEMNRRLVKEKKWMRSLAELVKQVREQVRLEVLKVEIQENDWMKSAIFKLSCMDGRMNQFQVKFHSENWKSRLSSFQYILSDQPEESLTNLLINGSFPDRWYVTQQGGAQ